MPKKAPLLLFLPLVAALSSCGGYSLGYIVSGNTYLSPIFKENYYCHWDDELKNASVARNVVLSSDDFITSFADIKDIDDKILADDPYADPSKYPTLEQKIRAYSSDQRLMNYDKTFYYGVQSKLFDGEAYCDSYYQRHRVQSNEQGFSVRFTKESDDLQYFAMQFKSTTNNQITCYPVGEDVTPINAEAEHKDDWLYHSSTINLKVNIYNKVDNGIVANHFEAQVTNNGTNNGGKYLFFGFDLKQYQITRCVGFSVTFDIVSDELIEHNQGKKIDDKDIVIDYALFIYEVFLPYTYWH